MNRPFDHEKLEVFQGSLAFIALIKANSDCRLHEGKSE